MAKQSLLFWGENWDSSSLTVWYMDFIPCGKRFIRCFLQNSSIRSLHSLCYIVLDDKELASSYTCFLCLA
jgi:hypothetical protein